MTTRRPAPAASDTSTLPEWAREAIDGPPRIEPGKEGDLRAWIRSRPPSVKALIRKFPPQCIVRATRPLMLPARGEVAFVVGWSECGLITVANPELPIDAQCEPSWLEVVAYASGLSPGWIATVLSD